MKKIFTIICSILICTSVTACSSSGPSNTINKFTESLKSGNIEDATTCVESKEDVDFNSIEGSFGDISAAEIYSVIFSKLDVEIDKETIKGDIATLDVTVKNVNLMTTMLTIAFSSSDIEDTTVLFDNLKTAIKESSTVDTKVTVNLVRKDKEWVLSSDNEPFMSAILGINKDTFESELKDSSDKVNELL